MFRILNRLDLNEFYLKLKNYRPIAKAPFSVLKSEEIMNRYNYILRGCANYLLPVVDNKKDYIRVHYILEYSSYDTIAKKLNSKISKIRERFGKPLIYTVEEIINFRQNEGHRVTKSKTFLLLKYLMMVKATKRRRILFRMGKFTNKNITSDVFNTLNTINKLENV
jgi:hypothetical protein